MYKKTTFRKAKLRIFIFSGLLLAASIVSPAQAQDVGVRLQRLENEIQTLSRAVFRGEKPPPGSLSTGENVSSTASATTELRLQQMEMEIRTLTGRIEEQNFETRQFEEHMLKTVEKLEQRINTLEKQLGVSSTSAADDQLPQSMAGVPGQRVSPGKQPATTQMDFPAYQDGRNIVQQQEQEQPVMDEKEGVATSSAPSMGQLGVLRQPLEDGGKQPAFTTETQAANDPVSLYERAFSFLRDDDYNKAEKTFSDFLTRYADHDLAPNAKYWLGETYYVRNNFERAARIFAEGYQQYPDGSKGPDNLLKLGMSLASMGKKEDACVTLSQLQKQYKRGAMPVLMRAEKEMEKLGCPL